VTVVVSWYRVAVSDLKRAELRHRHCVRRPSGPAELSESLSVGGSRPVDECDGHAGHDHRGQFQCELEKNESEDESRALVGPTGTRLVPNRLTHPDTRHDQLAAVPDRYDVHYR
jgi:hypothetical protein